MSCAKWFLISERCKATFCETENEDAMEADHDISSSPGSRGLRHRPALELLDSGHHASSLLWARSWLRHQKCKSNLTLNTV
ncbi:hypothetical protein J6590_067899 [Homalodisca vitripennis]|nr:hypothetical protein J6590_067899 [Homalodisca vitripennis]